jgi:2,4-diketo-3-deoxy-L-fuconate hydrolase
MMESFKLASASRAGSAPFVVLVQGDRALPLEQAQTGLPCGSIEELLQDWKASFAALAGLAEKGLDDPRWQKAVVPLTGLTLQAPLRRPPGLFFAAVNYPRPNRERKDAPDVVKRPYLFEKSVRCITGPYDDIIKPEGFDNIDYEVELALVIGKGGRRIPKERAMEHVAGFLIANDVTCRGFRKPGELPISGPDWFGSKCHDSFAPLGPFFVPRDFVPDCRNLRLTLKVNGELRQDGNSRDMVFSPEEQIAHVSNQLTLQPGDIFSTGTPEGFGAQSNVFLKIGDIVEAEIEGLGAQRNRLVARQ